MAIKVRQFGKVTYIESPTLGEVAEVRGNLTGRILARISQPKQSPPLKLVWYKSANGKVKDQIWRNKQ